MLLITFLFFMGIFPIVIRNEGIYMPVPVFQIEKIKKHENADSLSVVEIGGYRAIVRSADFKEGDLAAYIPEQYIVPPDLLQKIGLEGKLGGRTKNRVKAVKLRGVVSQGIVLKALPHWKVGQDVQDELLIIKYEPVIPAEMAGLVFQVPSSHSLHFDIENVKNFDNVLEKMEEDQVPVRFTEKLHGTLSKFTLVPDSLAVKCKDQFFTFLVSSKGMMAKNLSLQPSDSNLYWLIAREFSIEEKMRRVFAPELEQGKIVHLLGETFGAGVQDLRYTQKKDFRAFDICIVNPDLSSSYLDGPEFTRKVAELGLDTVPTLYEGPFTKEEMLKHTDGKETVSGKGYHIREGVVIKPLLEMNCDLFSIYNSRLGRLILKSVSEAYLFRKKGTEYR